MRKNGDKGFLTFGNNRAVINGSTGAIEQTTAYYPYGAVIADLGTGNSGQPFKFIGKELISANGLNVYDHGARLHYPAIPQFDRIDPLCDDYTWLSPYLYCGNDPVNAFDPDGRSTWVTDIGGGQFQVIGGDLNDRDRNVYVYSNDKYGKPTVRGKSIGKTATMTSFYQSDYNEGEGKWATESVIDMNDSSGEQFLSELMTNNPSMVSDYMPNAQNDRKYDFKSTNGTSEKIKGVNHYRGMPIGNAENGVPIIASARDIGNIGAGYIAVVNGLSWRLARTGFDTYRSTVSGYTTTEGLSTMTAEYYGYLIGRKSTTVWIRTCNMFRSVIDGVGFYMGKIYP